jgi:glycosyltransferase involved in cell wall biosynthesis
MIARGQAMPDHLGSPKLSILHVLTLNGRNGEYGGPVRVARELCTELNSRGHATHIFSGAREGSEPIPRSGLSESFILVKPISTRLAVSSLWSWRLIKPLNKLITNADVVHIHFARDLIPFLSAFIAILKKKPFVTQTHGMIISDGRISTRVTDFILTKPIMNRSRVNLVLTEKEMSSIKTLKLKSPAKILPNGIATETSIHLTDSSSNRVVFCSRLDKRKGIDKFINLADYFRESDLVFEIYGPDDGELEFCLDKITNRRLQNILAYKGALPSEKVQEVLAQAKVLILPSENEPFPMVVLESLAVGTPVLVMPSCGFAGVLRSFNENFVSKSESTTGLLESFESQLTNVKDRKNRNEIREFCSLVFGIASVTNDLLATYLRAINHGH